MAKETPLMALLLVAIGGCAGDSGTLRGEPTSETVTAQMVVAETGVTLPLPRDRNALANSMRRHYPPAFLAEGRRGAVLLDVEIDERGVVRSVSVVTPHPGGVAGGTPRHRAVLVDVDAATGERTQTVADLHYDAAFAPAAQAALREVRYVPATRDGTPVPYTLRTTIEFSPPADRGGRAH